MYQSPDFVKVDLDVKDNFAAYSGCPADIFYIGGHIEGECTNPGTYSRMVDDPNPHQCYSSLNEPV